MSELFDPKSLASSTTRVITLGAVYPEIYPKRFWIDLG
jgi:hypothetical protein